MGFPEYITAWTQVENEKLETRMEPEKKEYKFAVAVIGGNQSVVGHIMKDKTGRFTKTIFYFLRVSPYHRRSCYSTHFRPMFPFYTP